MPTNNKPSTQTQDPLPFIVTHKALSISLVALIVFAISGVSWWKHVYTSPRHVFEAMLNNNLSTTSVTRTTTDPSGSAPVDKSEQLSFVPGMAARTVVKITQDGNGSQTKVTTETIGTSTADYSRYTSINTSQKGTDGKLLDYKPVENLWGKSDPASGPPQYFQQATLGIMPFANLRAKDRQAVLKLIQDKKVYDVDYAKVKPLRLDGHSALVIPVKINTAGYVEALKAIAKAEGLNVASGLNPADYKDSPPIAVNLTVDKLSRQLLKTEYQTAAQAETYSAYGLSTPIAIPDKTISVDELQQKIQAIK